jgi:predicted RNA-binding protein with PIN domain
LLKRRPRIVPLLIDGYNLLHASGIMGRGRGSQALARSRDALLNVLAQSIPAEEIRRTTVVFDARDPPWGLSRQIDHQGITVFFASRHEDADSLIEELIKKHSTPRKLTVVSSDHRLHRAAKRRRATAIDSDVWLRALLKARQEATAASTDTIKPEGPFSDDEVSYWLRQFDVDGKRRPDEPSQ